MSLSAQLRPLWLDLGRPIKEQFRSFGVVAIRPIGDRIAYVAVGADAWRPDATEDASYRHQVLVDRFSADFSGRERHLHSEASTSAGARWLLVGEMEVSDRGDGLVLNTCASITPAARRAVSRYVLTFAATGGLVRLWSVLWTGWPHPVFIGTIVLELVVVPLVLWWHGRATAPVAPVATPA